MSILQRIQERQAGGVSEQVAQMDAEMVESQKPDAVQQTKSGRDAHRKALGGIPEPGQMTEVEPGPEEQAALTKMEKSMIEMIHGSGMSQKLLKAITSAQDPVSGIGNIASDIVLKLRRETPGVTDDALAALGQRTIEEIVELAELADPRIDLSEDDMAEAFSIGTQNYMKSEETEVDEAEMQEFLANG